MAPPPRYPSGGGGPSGPWFRPPTLAPHPKELWFEARPGEFSKARRVVQGDPAGGWDPYFSPGGVVWGVALHSPPWLFDPGFGPPPSPPTLYLWGIEAHAGGISKARGVVLGDPTGDWDAFPGPGEVVWGVALHASPPPPLPSPHLSTPAGRRDRLDLGSGTPPRAPQVSLVQRGKRFRRPGEAC